MKREIDEGRGQIFHRGETLVEVARGHQALEQFFRNRFAGSVMGCIAAQDVRLRASARRAGRKLDEVSRHSRAREQRIGHVREQAVQSVAEFVEKRAGVVEAQKRRLACRTLGEFITLTMIGRMSPVSLSCERKALIQAPLRWNCAPK